jgi:nucleoside-diphosphate-sugar epimerase
MDGVRATVLLTGGTGFVGSHLATGLMRDGVHVVFLTRDKPGTPAAQRVREVMRWHHQLDDSRYSVASGDITRPCFGLPAEDYQLLAARCSEIWHCASETTFLEKRRPLLELVNLDGTRHVLDFAGHSDARMVNYVSTSYCVGRRAGRCEERLLPQDEFHNPYEETKHRAEMMLAQWCQDTGVPFLIYRPSIVAGDSLTGRTMLFNGMYYPLRVIDYLRRQVLADWAENDGRNVRPLGAKVLDDGRVHLPIRIRTTRGASSAVNVVPIDFVRDTCLQARDRVEAGSVVHVVNDHAVELTSLADVIGDVLRVEGVRVVPDDEGDASSPSGLEDLFRSRIAVYQPYIDDDREYADDHMAGLGTRCPPTDRAYLERCLRFAMACGWNSEVARAPAGEQVGVR